MDSASRSQIVETLSGKLESVSDYKGTNSAAFCGFVSGCENLRHVVREALAAVPVEDCFSHTTGEATHVARSCGQSFPDQDIWYALY